ncbi:L-seryl-tRNA(Sec) selenium transferase [Desulfoluna spongiiphila]|uniref:L-seryl-tRNA(Sec) selenium transferase n=1 Tax=Desulfoluna spongiiphila TaxID=419481 RepID=A0A1G5CPS1_9BACT|nr:L-seryl-tRNA(Sec) selenium transferase [Desulfoluna spongiiphila]SCY04261.1 L-seryl-tRNA(Sec) selenium transferase [Desulfoluna spongiiphila]
MELRDTQKQLLRALPGVDTLLDALTAEIPEETVPRSVLTASAREALEATRRAIFTGTHPTVDLASVLTLAHDLIHRKMRPNLTRVINGTGVVVHTNLGRSLLAEEALDRIRAVGDRYSNLEFNLATGKRGLRYSAVEELICEISGAEAAMVVNNNAGAVLLCLDTLVNGKEAVVSRGELVEIGGAFRIPDVMAKSGGILKEVGTTNRTHLRDYEQAVTDETGLFLKVHTSNYSIVGFTSAVSVAELVTLGKERGIPVMDDLGSGTFVDFGDYGLPSEPTVQQSVKAGADIVTFSGDKLLGGPQAGVIVGSKTHIDAIRKNPLTRALRIDKLTLAALEATLRLYRDEAEAVAKIPTLRMITMDREETVARATALMDALATLPVTTEALALSSRPGGGSLPLLELPSCCVGITVPGMGASALEKTLRANDPPVIGRIENETYILDPRTLQEGDISLIADALETLVEARP